MVSLDNRQRLAGHCLIEVHPKAGALTPDGIGLETNQVASRERRAHDSEHHICPDPAPWLVVCTTGGPLAERELQRLDGVRDSHQPLDVVLPQQACHLFDYVVDGQAARGYASAGRGGQGWALRHLEPGAAGSCPGLFCPARRDGLPGDRCKAQAGPGQAATPS